MLEIVLKTNFLSNFRITETLTFNFFRHGILYMANKLKVLSLGWEFPPIINGGLGVACYGLSKSLASIVDLTLILPKTEAGASLPNGTIIGLTGLNADLYTRQLVTEKVSYETFSKVFEIPANFSPYTDNVRANEAAVITETKKSVTKEVTSTETTSLPKFDIEHLYGQDIFEKVHQYAQMVAAVAATLEFDVIHAHDWMTFPAALLLKAQTGKPMVLHVHALETDRSGTDNRGYVYQLEREALHQADAVISVSNLTKQSMERFYQLDGDKIFVVHNSVVPVKAFKTVKPFPEKMVLFLGRLTGQKGPSYFIEVAQRVLDKNPDTRFVMAGTGEKFKNLIETGAYKKLGSRFHFTGFMEREQVDKLLSMADVYCMPSVSEPFGLSALEAVQFGVPTVLSRQSGVSEVLHSALKADFWDVDRMAKHIIDLLQNPELSEKIVRKSFEDLESLTWDHAAKSVVTVFNRLAKK